MDGKHNRCIVLVDSNQNISFSCDAVRDLAFTTCVHCTRRDSMKICGSIAVLRKGRYVCDNFDAQNEALRIARFAIMKEKSERDEMIGILTEGVDNG